MQKIRLECSGFSQTAMHIEGTTVVYCSDSTMKELNTTSLTELLYCRRLCITSSEGVAHVMPSNLLCHNHASIPVHGLT